MTLKSKSKPGKLAEFDDQALKFLIDTLCRYKISVSTSSLHSHLYNKHQIDSRSDNRAASSGAQDTLKGFFKITKTSKTHSKAASLPGDIFLWFAHALLPHNTIEDEGTKLFLGKYLGISPEQIPGRNAIERAGNCKLEIVLLTIFLPYF